MQEGKIPRANLHRFRSQWLCQIKSLGFEACALTCSKSCLKLSQTCTRTCRPHVPYKPWRTCSKSSLLCWFHWAWTAILRLPVLCSVDPCRFQVLSIWIYYIQPAERSLVSISTTCYIIWHGQDTLGLLVCFDRGFKNHWLPNRTLCGPIPSCHA